MRTIRQFDSAIRQLQIEARKRGQELTDTECIALLTGPEGDQVKLFLAGLPPIKQSTVITKARIA